MDVNKDFKEVLEDEKQRLTTRIKRLNDEAINIWKHATIGHHENEIFYDNSKLTREDIEKREVLEQRLNEDDAKLAIFNYLINLWSRYAEKKQTIPPELAEYLNISISSDFTIVNEDDIRNKKYGFVLFSGNRISYKKPNIPFQNYMKLYEDNLKKELMIIFLGSKGISKIDLTDEELFGYQFEYGLEITKALAQACSSLLEESQVVPTIK